MRINTLVLSLTSIIVCSRAFCQDKIYKENGEVIDAKIKSVGIKTITYSRFDNQSGPEYTLLKVDVERIKYQNGSEDVFELAGRRRFGPHPHVRKETSVDVTDQHNIAVYGRNMLSLAPMQFTENGAGFGLCYERTLVREGILTLEIPFAATYNFNSTHLNPATQQYENARSDGMYYLMPGLKLYPTGNGGLCRYAVGPTVVLGIGQKSADAYDPISGNLYYQTQTHTVAGIMISNSLNINANSHIYIGIQFGLGFSYINKVGGLNQGTETLNTGAIRIGYRW